MSVREPIGKKLRFEVFKRDIDDLERRAKKMHSIKDFEGPLDEWLKSIGEPY